jgi:hypothetical protein
VHRSVLGNQDVLSTVAGHRDDGQRDQHLRHASY